MFTHADLLNEASYLKKLAIKLTCNLRDADKLLQSTLSTALDKQATFQSDMSLFSWTSKIMFEIFALSHVAPNHTEVADLDGQIYIDRHASNAIELDDQEVNQAFSAMAALPAEYREILVMVCLEGMSYRAVSRVLEIPLDEVRLRLSRARNALDESLKCARLAAPQVPSAVHGAEFRPDEMANAFA